MNQKPITSPMPCDADRRLKAVHATQRGLTLLEMLLAVGVIGMLMVMVSRVSADFIKQRDAQIAGQQLYHMSDIVEDVILRNNPDMGGFTSYLVNGTTTGPAGDINKALLNNGFEIDDPSFFVARSPVQVIYATNVSGGGAGSSTFMVRVMVVLQKPFPLAQAVKIARAAGTRGGVIHPAAPTVLTSAFGNWTFPISSYMGGRMSLLPARPDEAYVAAYRAIAPTDVRGPYLDIYGNNGGNVMHTDLLMNGNSIVKTKDVEAAVVTATKGARFDQLKVNGQATFQGGLDANDRVNVKKNLVIEEGDMGITNGNLDVFGGTVNAKGLRADKLEADDLTTTDVTAKTLTVDGGDTLVTSKLTVSGGASFDITGPLKATVVDADDIKTDTLKTTSMDVKGKTTLSGETTINSTANIDQLVLDGCMTLNGATYGTCR